MPLAGSSLAAGGSGAGVARGGVSEAVSGSRRTPPPPRRGASHPPPAAPVERGRPACSGRSGAWLGDSPRLPLPPRPPLLCPAGTCSRPDLAAVLGRRAREGVAFARRPARLRNVCAEQRSPPALPTPRPRSPRCARGIRCLRGGSLPTWGRTFPFALRTSYFQARTFEVQSVKKQWCFPSLFFFFFFCVCDRS